MPSIHRNAKLKKKLKGNAKDSYCFVRVNVGTRAKRRCDRKPVQQKFQLATDDVSAACVDLNQCRALWDISEHHETFTENMLNSVQKGTSVLLRTKMKLFHNVRVL